MIRAGVAVFIVFMLGIPAYIGSALAADPQPVQEEVQAQAQPKRLSPEEQKKIAAMRKQIQVMRTEINGSSWDVAFNSSSPELKGQKDTFIFQNGQMDSKSMSKRGFGVTNYTVTAPAEDSQIAVWETMKTGKDGIAFLRGEWKDEVMTGTISERLDEGKTTREYYFTSSSRVGVSPTSEEDNAAGSSLADNKEAGVAKALVSKEAIPSSDTKKK